MCFNVFKCTSPKMITNFLIKFLSITGNLTENLSNSLCCVLIHGAVDIDYIYLLTYLLTYLLHDAESFLRS